MSDLVERLAKKWHHDICCLSDEIDDDDRMVAAFFVGAIADELEESLDDGLEVDVGNGVVYSGEVSARWLRSQANGGDDV